MNRASIIAVTVCLFAMLCGPPSQAQDLRSEELFRGREIIERIYHSYRIGSNEAFERDVPSPTIEARIRYELMLEAGLPPSVRAGITPERLDAEIVRIKRETLMSGRLREILDGLGNDPRLIRECLARPTLVARLALSSGSGVSAGAIAPSATVRQASLQERWESLPEAGAPSPRDLSTAVWTGNYLVVWGGRNVSLDGLGTGALFDPVTASWSAMAATNAPSPRWQHTAVWTGKEMLVWGGVSRQDGDELATGARYSPPPADRWTPITVDGAPTGRNAHSAVWTGSEMLVWGGNDGSTLVATGARYSPTLDRWAAIAATGAPAPRGLHTAVWTGREMLVWGGASPIPGIHYGDGARYNPVSDTWATIPIVAAPSPRSRHTAVWTGTRLLIWGGQNASSPLGDGAEFDPVSNSWSPLPTALAPSARYAHTAVWANGEMIVFGGATCDACPGVSTGGVYQASLREWRALPQDGAPAPRANHVAAWTGSAMLVWGGSNAWPNFLSSGGRYVPAFRLQFPLERTTPCRSGACGTACTAAISSVMDHSGTPLDPRPEVAAAATWYSTKDRAVVAFTGETGNVISNCPPAGYSQDAPPTTRFRINGNYVGARCPRLPDSTAPMFLNYDGHAGYDFPAGSDTSIRAAADGKLRRLDLDPADDPVNTCRGRFPNTPWARFHTFYIDHENGYSTWYLHAAALDPTVAVEIDQSPDHSTTVRKGQVIGSVGNACNAVLCPNACPVATHLHFELRTYELGSDPAKSTTVVDPYSLGAWDIGCEGGTCCPRPNADGLFDVH